MMSSIIVPRARLLHWVITDGICYVSVVSSVPSKSFLRMTVPLLLLQINKSLRWGLSSQINRLN